MAPSTNGNKYNEGWEEKGWRRWGGFWVGGRDVRSYYEHTLLLFSPLCPPVNHPIVCGIHRAPCNFNDPQHAQISRFSSAPSFYLVPNTPTCLLCDQYVVSWNEATGFNMILRDQIAPFDPPPRCVWSPISDSLQCSYAYYVEEQEEKNMWEGKQHCPCSRESVC